MDLNQDPYQEKWVEKVIEDPGEEKSQTETKITKNQTPDPSCKDHVVLDIDQPNDSVKADVNKR